MEPPPPPPPPPSSVQFPDLYADQSSSSSSGVSPSSSSSSLGGSGSSSPTAALNVTKRRRLDELKSRHQNIPNPNNGKNIKKEHSLSLNSLNEAHLENISWQETKMTIKDRTACLVNSPRLSDITFLVGDLETPIYGHKTILSAGSPFFEKLFFGMMAHTDKILKIPDVEPEVFLGFLKYLYTDEFDTTTMEDVDAMLLLKPAKIYIVPHLAQKCVDLLITKMSATNVFLIYQRALIFDENKLAEVCLRFLDRQIDKVVDTEEFLEIDLDTLTSLLERENLRINECALFKAVYNWTIAECKRKEFDLTPENQRSTLGGAINLIRFPVMTQEEFSLEVVPKQILTNEEVITVFMNLCIGAEKKDSRPETPFIKEKRFFRPKANYLNRFSEVLSKVIHFGGNFSMTNNLDTVYNSTLKFRVDQRIFIHGTGIYAVSSSNSGLKFNASVSLFCQSYPLGSKVMNGKSRNFDYRMPLHIIFDEPIEIRPDEDYNLTCSLKLLREVVLPNGTLQNVFPFGSAAYQNGSNQVDAYYGIKTRPSIQVECPSEGVSVSFTFPNVSLLAGESFINGQIPQIIFSV